MTLSQTALREAVSPCGGTPSSGSRKFWMRPPWPVKVLSHAPATSASRPSTSSGMVITGGDSCGWRPCGQRRSPKKVRNTSRDM
jgi:hypothetical protein